MSQLRNNFFGPFRVTRDDKTVLGFESDKMRALLAYLIVEADRPHPREALAALLWPDQTDTAARQSLRQALYVLRHALNDDNGGDKAARIQNLSSNEGKAGGNSGAAEPLLITRQTAQFNRASDTWCDVWVFNNLLAACDAHTQDHHRQLRNPDRCTECVERLQQA